MDSPFYNLPAAIPPPGVSPNFVNPPSQKLAIEVLDCVFTSLMLAVVLVRIYVRWRITKTWALDDYACVIAALGSVAHMVIYFQFYKIGFGRHLWDIRASTLLDNSNTRLLSANGIAYPFTIFFAKLSVLLLYLRIFHVYVGIRYAVYFGIIFQALFYTSMIGVAIGSIVVCTSTARLTSAFCANYAGPVVILNGAFNSASDFYVLLLPIYRTFKLNMSWERKIGLLVVFLSGFAACAASLARLVMFSVKLDSSDVLWDQATNAKFTIVEINIAIMVACASCFPPFSRKLRDTGSSVYRYLRSRSGGGSGASSGQSGSPKASPEKRQRRGKVTSTPTLPAFAGLSDSENQDDPAEKALFKEQNEVTVEKASDETGITESASGSSSPV